MKMSGFFVEGLTRVYLIQSHMVLLRMSTLISAVQNAACKVPTPWCDICLNDVWWWFVIVPADGGLSIASRRVM